MTKKSKETEYKDSDVVTIKVHPFVDNYVVPNWEANPENPSKLLSPTVLGKAKDGPFEIETTGRSVRDLLLDVEPEPEAWESAEKRFAKVKERFRVRLENDSAFASMTESDRAEQIEGELKVWGMSHSASRTFFESEGRGRLALSDVEVLENKGPRFSDNAARFESDRDFIELMKEKMKRDMMREIAAEEALANESKK